MTNGDPLPDELVLSRDEAAETHFAIDDAIAAAEPGSPLHLRLRAVESMPVNKFLPDLEGL